MLVWKHQTVHGLEVGNADMCAYVLSCESSIVAWEPEISGGACCKAKYFTPKRMR